MIVDNFDLIKKYVMEHTVPSEENFYFCQIMQRKKDFDKTNCQFTGNNRILKTYYIRRQDWFDYKKDEVVNFCKLNNARAMININPKSMQRLTLEILKQAAQIAWDNNYSGILKVVDSSAGQLGATENKVWIIDIDNCDVPESEFKKQFTEQIDFINNLEPEGEKCKLLVPTKSGYHLICSPFNLQKFRKKYVNIDVHKNNPTLLYLNNENF